MEEPHKHKADNDNIIIKPPTSDGHGGDRKSEQVKIKNDNISLDPGRGRWEEMSRLNRRATVRNRKATCQTAKIILDKHLN